MAMIIGLSGRRQRGKSTVADRLVEAHGFQRIHPFNGGKAACRAYYEHIGIPAGEAERMINGDLKDVASPFLPGGATSRSFMEAFGRFMGVDMGPDWTLGRELLREIDRNPDARIIVESVVYEVEIIRQLGGKVVMVDAPSRTAGLGAESPDMPTNKATEQIVPDLVLRHNWEGLDMLHDAVDEMMIDLDLDLAPEPC